MNATTAQSVLHYLKQHGRIDRGTRLYVANAMRNCRKVIAAAAVATLAACGGGGDSGEIEAICEPAHVQVFGDSNASRYAKALQIVADEARGKGAVIVENKAVGGATSQMMIDGTDGKNKPWPIGVKADRVFVNNGTNDKRLNIPIPVYVQNLRTFQAAGAVVMVPPPLPATGFEHTYGAAARAIEGAIDADALIQSITGWQAHFPDGIHPDPELSQIVARELLLPLVPMCGGAK